MREMLKRRCLVTLLSISLIYAGHTSVALAGFVGAQEVLAPGQTVVSAEREQVMSRLAALGVAPELVAARVAALTPAEVDQLDRQLDSLPAGAGAIEIIGIVFLVLLILELVGVIDIFKKI